MNFNLLKYGAIGVAVVGYIGYTAFQGSRPQAADLGAVLDRTEYALNNYEAEIEGETATDAEMDAFTGYMANVMNLPTRFYDKTLGLELREDAVFVGFSDENANGARDSGEKDVFTVEIDEANSRLIATDTSGESVHHRYSGRGLLTGLLIGNLLSRQSRAGISKSSFSNRKSTARSSYKPKASARSSSRSGGSRAGK